LMNGLLETDKFKPPWIIAHRGFRAKYPENTLVAFQAALDAGVTMIELDVTHTRDGKLVVMHDITLDRTTNGRGPVNGYFLKELKKLDAGSWFNPVFASQHVPELEEVLELVQGKALINIEIKPNPDELIHPPDAIERQVIELVNRKNAHDAVLISSFDRTILEKIKSLKNPPALALISRDPADSSTLSFCRRLKIFSWHPSHTILSHEQVNLMHSANIRVFPYNADTPEEVKRMFDMNVDGIISNDPLFVIDWLGHHKAA
jgi:glycerophosphoryl diester phosphodiesterase